MTSTKIEFRYLVLTALLVMDAVAILLATGLVR